MGSRPGGSDDPAVSVSGVARRHRINPNRLFSRGSRGDWNRPGIRARIRERLDVFRCDLAHRVRCEAHKYLWQLYEASKEEIMVDARFYVVGMTTTEHAANAARAFMAAEIAMASVNCGAPVVTRTQAEKLLDLYFALVEQAVPWSENNPLDRRS